MARTVQEKAIDRLFALHVIDRCRTRHGLDSISETKMHKLMFYAQKKLYECRCRVTNYIFIKLLFPTFSPDLRTDLNELSSLGFLSSGYFSEEQKARMILEDFQHVFNDNKEIVSIIDEQVDKYAPVDTNVLVSKTKRLPWRNTILGELKNGTPLVYPLKREKARCILKISDNDLEDLLICLSPTVSAAMEKASMELRAGQRLTHEEVFG